MKNPVIDLRGYVDTRLIEDADLSAVLGDRIYFEEAPLKAGSKAEPFITFTFLSVRHVNGNGAMRGMSDVLLQITGHAVGNEMSTLETVAHRIDTLFAGQFMGQYGDLHVAGGVGEEAIHDTQFLNNTMYQRAGGVYRLFCHY